MFKKHKLLGIKGKIILPLLIIIVLGVSLILGTLLSFFTTTLDDISQDMMLEMGEHYENLIGRNIDTQLATARLLVPIMQQVATEDMSREDALILLKDILASDRSIAGIYTCWEPTFFEGKVITEDNMNGFNSKGSFAPYITKDSTGQVKLETNENYEKQYYYILPKTSKKETIIDPYYSYISSTPTYVSSIVEPIFLDGEFVGIVGIDILLDSVADTLKNATLFDNGHVFVISNKGLIISHQNGELIGKSLFSYVSSEEKSEIENSLENNKIIQFTSLNSITNNTSDNVSSEKKNIIKNFITRNKIDQLNPLSSITNTTYKNKLIPLRIGDTGISWGVGISVPTSEVNAPIRLGLYIGLGISLIVCALAILLVLFVMEKLKKNIYKIIERLTQSSSQVLSASNQLAVASQELADGTNEQAASIEETSASMEETSSMVKQNAENSKTASSLSIEAKDSADIGSEKMNTLAKSMKKLEESGNQISKIITVIDDIAFQTNILALNAAIEAARAGDAGKGFGVVAEEVRSLAQKSADAAKDTSRLLESNIELTTINANESEDVKQSLNIITSKVENAVSLIAEVSAASDEQSKGVEQITNAINSMEQVVQNNAASAEESATASEELQSQSKELESVINDLIILMKGSKKSKKSKKTVSKKVSAPKNSLKDKQDKSLKIKEYDENIDNNTVIQQEKHIVTPEEIIPLDEDNEF